MITTLINMLIYPSINQWIHSLNHTINWGPFVCYDGDIFVWSATYDNDNNPKWLMALVALTWKDGTNASYNSAKKIKNNTITWMLHKIC